MFVTVPIRCSRSGERFALILTKSPGEGVYKIHRVVTANEHTAASPPSGRMSNDEFPWEDFVCPGCQYCDENGFCTVYCDDCGETLCGRAYSRGEFSCLCGESYPLKPMDYMARNSDS